MMFKKIPLVMVMLLLSVFAVSCNRSEEEATNEEETPTETTTETTPPDSPSANVDNQQTPTAGTQPFQPRPTVTGTATLIPPTSPQQRRQQIATGRPDPYAPFPSKVDVARPEETAVNGTAPSPPDQGVSPSSPNAPNATGIVPQDPSIPPPPPNPEDAKAVFVSGVIQLGGTPIAILTAPGDPGTRHVKPGAMIAGGRVMVKSINTGTKKPFVVLEQYGQEVTKVVGETPANEAPAES